jgi:hypothetical protein
MAATQDSQVPIRSVLLILFLLAGSLSPPALAAQGSPAAPRSTATLPCFSIEPTYPPTESPERLIPFVLDNSCFGPTGRVEVTMRIYNSINQLVTIPEAVDHPSGSGVRILNLEYTEPGHYFARLDGRHLSGRPIDTGVYFVRLFVNGIERITRIVIDNPRGRRRIF